MYSRILVPHDGSSFAEQVLPHAVEIAKRFEAEIHLLEVIEPPNPAVFTSDLEGGAGAPMAIEAKRMGASDSISVSPTGMTYSSPSVSSTK